MGNSLTRKKKPSEAETCERKIEMAKSTGVLNLNEMVINYTIIANITISCNNLQNLYSQIFLLEIKTGK